MSPVACFKPSSTTFRSCLLVTSSFQPLCCCDCLHQLQYPLRVNKIAGCAKIAAHLLVIFLSQLRLGSPLKSCLLLFPIFCKARHVFRVLSSISNWCSIISCLSTTCKSTHSKKTTLSTTKATHCSSTMAVDRASPTTNYNANFAR